MAIEYFQKAEDMGDSHAYTALSNLLNLLGQLNGIQQGEEATPCQIAK